MNEPTETCLDALIPGAVNFRDLGGLPARGGAVRPGCLFRSGMTHEITAPGFAYLRDTLGMRTVIDLRSDAEHAHDGCADFDRHRIRLRKMPIYAVTALTPEEQQERYIQMRRREYDWADRYRVLVSDYPGAFRAFFETIADPANLPAVFHCAGGRDRTGIAAAFVLSVLGVADDVIAADYARTGAHLRRHAHRFRRVREKMGFTDHDVAEMLETEADDMLRFLGWLRAEHGGTEAFLRKAGVPDRTLDTLRADLIVPR